MQNIPKATTNKKKNVFQKLFPVWFGYKTINNKQQSIVTKHQDCLRLKQAGFI